MRISSGYQFDTYGRDIADAQQRLFDASRQMSTGKRINTLSDDPYGGARSVKMRSLQSAINQYGENLKTAKGTLGYTEGTLSEVSTLLNRASAIAVSGANGATDQKGRDAMAAEITQMQARLVDLANTKGPNGSYIFAGQKSNTKPYNVAGSTVTFNGDTNPTMSEVGPGEMMTVSTPGEPMFSDLYNRLEGLKTNLVGGNTGAISGIDIANVQASQAAISSARGNLGSKLKQVDDLSAQWTRRSDDLTQSISDVEDVDITEAMLKYQQANQAYTAALTVASQGFRLSLMDFIKG